MIKRVALLSAMALGIASLASAAPITYTHSGFGSGTLDGVAFGSLAPVAFTITAQGDTDNIQVCNATCVFIDNDSASIEIAGVGTFDFVTATRYFSYFNLVSGDTTVGFSRAGLFGADLFDGPESAGPWDMTTSLGPVLGIAGLIQWGGGDVITNAGVLIFNTANTESTFTARVGDVPEPASLLLLGMGLAAYARKRVRA